jgi:hypothetical protein
MAPIPVPEMDATGQNSQRTGVVERGTPTVSAFKRRQIRRVRRVVSGALEPGERLLVASEVQTRPRLPRWFRWIELLEVVHGIALLALPFILWFFKNRLVGLTDHRVVITRRRRRWFRRGTRTVVALDRSTTRIEAGTGAPVLQLASDNGVRVRLVFPSRWWPQGRAIARALPMSRRPAIDRSFWGIPPSK